MRWVSEDRTWLVYPVRLNEVDLLRVVNTKTMVGLPLHSDGVHRMGPVRMRDGWWAADVRSPADVERFVPLTELVEEDEHHVDE